MTRLQFRETPALNLSTDTSPENSIRLEINRIKKTSHVKDVSVRAGVAGFVFTECKSATFEEVLLS